jgi:hypothetical protein
MAESDGSASRRRRRPDDRDDVRRVLPAIALFLLAPLVAEYLLGNLPITWLFALVVLAPMYGGGALLMREAARRRGRGLGTVLVLGVAYGVLEEGLVTQSLFNPATSAPTCSTRASSRPWGSPRRGRSSSSPCTPCGARTARS